MMLEHLKFLQILDAELFEHMHQNGDYTHFYFCYRWFLLDFKRGKLTLTIGISSIISGMYVPGPTINLLNFVSDSRKLCSHLMKFGPIVYPKFPRKLFCSKEIRP